MSKASPSRRRATRAKDGDAEFNRRRPIVARGANAPPRKQIPRRCLLAHEYSWRSLRDLHSRPNGVCDSLHLLFPTLRRARTRRQNPGGIVARLNALPSQDRNDIGAPGRPFGRRRWNPKAARGSERKRLAYLAIVPDAIREFIDAHRFGVKGRSFFSL
jgi:hypothetical protein